MLFMIFPAVTDMVVLSVILIGLVVMYFDLKVRDPFSAPRAVAKKQFKPIGIPGFSVSHGLSNAAHFQGK